MQEVWDDWDCCPVAWSEDTAAAAQSPIPVAEAAFRASSCGRACLLSMLSGPVVGTALPVSRALRGCRPAVGMTYCSHRATVPGTLLRHVSALSRNIAGSDEYRECRAKPVYLQEARRRSPGKARVNPATVLGRVRAVGQRPIHISTMAVAGWPQLRRYCSRDN